MKISFVVLHYCKADVTIKCVDSILDINCSVVVVDNASPDGSGQKLKKHYQHQNNVHVILNNNNLGFASGNNIGYKYAKEEQKAKIIIVVNNDTYISDKAFAQKILESNYINSYHIIAPNIINKLGEHQNPFHKSALSKEEIIKGYKTMKVLRWIYSIPIIGTLKLYFHVQKRKVESFDYRNPQDMIVPHGAAIIYSPLWVENEDFAFYPGTFMYVEEELLYYYLMSKGYKTIYAPNIEIHHLEDVSTNTRFRNIRKKKLFQAKQKTKSYKLLIDLIETDKKN